MIDLLAQSYNYSSSYDSSSAMSSGESATISAAVILFIFIIFIVVWLILAIPTWKIFVKAGRTGWHALIPIYSQWVMYEISGKPGYWSLAIFIPFVGSLLGSIAAIVAMLQLAKNFGKDTTFAIVWLIIFPIVGLFILAFGDAKYLGPDTIGTESGRMPSLGTPQPNLAQSTPPTNNIPNSNVQPTTQPPVQPSANSGSPQPSANGAQPPSPPNQNPPTV